MGLDFSHCEAHWSYSGFNVFRRMLAQSIGIIDSIEKDIYGYDELYKELKDDDIYPLIDHSDNEGSLTVEEMKQVLPRLQMITDKWTLEEGYLYQFNLEQARNLIDGMSDAIENDELLDFR